VSLPGGVGRSVTWRLLCSNDWNLMAACGANERDGGVARLHRRSFRSGFVDCLNILTAT
jgi:hypothetical protein